MSELSLPADAGEWDDLADRARATLFLRPAYVGAWHRAFGSGELRILAIRRDGRLAAVLPLQEARSGSLRSPTNYHTPEYGFLAEDAEAAVELARAAFARRPRSVFLQFVEQGGFGLDEWRSAARSGGYTLRERVLERSPWITTVGDWDEYQRTIGAKAIADVRRRRRRLEEVGTVSIDLGDGGSHLDATLAEGFAVEAAGWKGERGTAILSRPETRGFYEELARIARARGALHVAFLRVDGRGVAFELNLREGGIHYRIKAGFDPGFGRFAPSKLLLHAVIGDCFGQSMDRFEFLGTDDAYKLEWASEVREMLLVQAFAGGVAGRIELGAYDYGRPLAKRVLGLVGR